MRASWCRTFRNRQHERVKRRPSTCSRVEHCSGATPAANDRVPSSASSGAPDSRVSNVCLTGSCRGCKRWAPPQGDEGRSGQMIGGWPSSPSQVRRVQILDIRNTCNANHSAGTPQPQTNRNYRRCKVHARAGLDIEGRLGEAHLTATAGLRLPPARTAASASPPPSSQHQPAA